jgi:hypothetical protein
LRRPRQHTDRSSEPVLITEAAPSYDEEFTARKRRYTLIMACRIPCLILAGVFGIGFNWPLVALAFIVLSVPLPWVAVLIANDRTPNKARKVNRYRREPTRLEPVSDRRILEAAEVLEARDSRGDQAAPRTGTDG